MSLEGSTLNFPAPFSTRARLGLGGRSASHGCSSGYGYPTIHRSANSNGMPTTNSAYSISSSSMSPFYPSSSSSSRYDFSFGMGPPSDQRMPSSMQDITTVPELRGCLRFYRWDVFNYCQRKLLLIIIFYTWLSSSLLLLLLSILLLFQLLVFLMPGLITELSLYYNWCRRFYFRPKRFFLKSYKKQPFLFKDLTMCMFRTINDHKPIWSLDLTGQRLLMTNNGCGLIIYWTSS